MHLEHFIFSLSIVIVVVYAKLCMFIVIWWCTDQSSNLGIDQSHGGAPKAGSTRRLGGWASVSGSSRVRVAEEGVTSRRGALRPRTSITQTVKMSWKRWCPSHIPALSKGEVKCTEGPCMGCGRGGRVRHNQRAPGKETTGKGHVPGVICMHGTWIDRALPGRMTRRLVAFVGTQVVIPRRLHSSKGVLRTKWP